MIERDPRRRKMRMTRSWRYFEVLASLVWDYGRMCLVNHRIPAMNFQDGLVDMKDEFLSLVGIFDGY